MAQHYLYPRQRQIEVISALYVGGLGAFIHLVDMFKGRAPIGWIGLDREGQVALGTVLLLSALMWAFGIKINGSRWWSPFLRLVAMLIDLFICVFATWQGNGTSATYTYGWVTIFLMVGVWNAARDSAKSFEGHQQWTT